MREKCLAVCGGILVAEGKILAAQRADARELAGYWEFPGGKIEKAESPEAALRRELREELDIEVRVGDFFARSEFSYSFGIVILDTYFCFGAYKEFPKRVHKDFRWLRPEELFSVMWAPADIPIIQKLIAEKENYLSFFY